MINSLKRLMRKIGEINYRYRTPRIQMSRRVRLALMLLRVYLLFLVALMVYKFVLLVS